jgi:RNA polymerase subunit RPABC4/transcription elongation factor Spt4
MEKVDPEVSVMLMQGEKILLAASQSKSAPGGAVSSPSKIYITINRVLFKSTGAFGLKAKIIDIRYDEIATVMLKRGVFSTEIMLKPRSSPGKIVLPAVDKQVALQVSSFIQKGMRKELAGTPVPKERAAPKPDPFVKLERLAEMKREGTITEAEFQILKEEMMLTLKPEISGEAPPRPAQAFAATPAFKQLPAEKPEQPAVQPAPVLEKPKEESAACRHCNSAVPRTAKFCPECGKDLQAETNIWKMCPSCDALASNDAVFCTSCNQRFPETLS